MIINHSNFKNIDNESFFKDFSNVFLFDNLYKTALGFESAYKTLITDIDAALVGLLENKDFSKEFFTEIERSLFKCVNAYYQLVEHIKKAFPKKTSQPHSKPIKVLSFFIENKQGYKTFTKLRNYIQHSYNIPFYISLSDGKPYIFINKNILSEDKRFKYSFDKEINSKFNFDMLNLTYDFIEESSKVVNYLFFIISKEVISEMNSYINYFGWGCIESDKMLMARIEKGDGGNDYYPCPQKSVVEFKKIHNSDTHRSLYDAIGEDINNYEFGGGESYLWMENDFIKELGQKEGEKMYNEFLNSITMPPHVMETFNNFLKFESPEDAKSAKLERIKKIRNTRLFDCAFI